MTLPLDITGALAHRVLAMLSEVSPAADPDQTSATTSHIRLAIGVHGERVITVAATDGKILMEREDTVPLKEWSLLLDATWDTLIPGRMPWKSMARAATVKGNYGVHLLVHDTNRTLNGKPVQEGQWTFPNGAAGPRFDVPTATFPAYRMAFDSQCLGTPTTPNPLGINAGLLARLTEAWPHGTLSMTYGRGCIFKPVPQDEGIIRRALIMPTTLSN